MVPPERVTHGREPGYDPEADVLSYDQDTFGRPRRVVLNGQRIHGVQGIEVNGLYTEEDFVEVVIKLKGTYVSVNATPRESSAQDSGS